MKVRACPSYHAATLALLSSDATCGLIRLGCSRAVGAARAVFASPGQVPAAASYRAVAAGASSAAQKVCHRRQDSNSCLICPLLRVAHAFCGYASVGSERRRGGSRRAVGGQAVPRGHSDASCDPGDAYTQLS